MCIFAAEKFSLVKEDGELNFLKLIKNGECQIDKFIDSIKKGSVDYKKLIKIFATMDYIATYNRLLPKEKFNSIKDGDKVIGYEFKQKDLRIYCLKKDPNVLLILGGYKVTQKKDVDTFKKTICEAKDYINEILV